MTSSMPVDHSKNIINSNLVYAIILHLSLSLSAIVKLKTLLYLNIFQTLFFLLPLPVQTQRNKFKKKKKIYNSKTIYLPYQTKREREIRTVELLNIKSEIGDK